MWLSEEEAKRNQNPFMVVPLSQKKKDGIQQQRSETSVVISHRTRETDSSCSARHNTMRMPKSCWTYLWVVVDVDHDIHVGQVFQYG